VTLHGGAGDDWFATAAAHADVMHGYGGNDEFNIRPDDSAYGGSGDDIFDLSETVQDVSGSVSDGGSGRDLLELAFGWTVDLLAGLADSPFSGQVDTYTFISMEDVEVSAWHGYNTYVQGDQTANHFSINP